MSALTPKQQRFITEYLIDLNGKQAAVRAGYSPHTAQEQSSRLLSLAKVQEAVGEAQKASEGAAGITRERVLAELALLSFSDLTHYVVDDKGDVQLSAGAPAGAMRALQSIKRRITARGSGDDQIVTREVEIKLWDKPGPLKLAGQHVGLFTDKLNVTGAVALTAFTLKLNDRDDPDGRI